MTRFLPALALALAGCSRDVGGSAQKGPMLLGSTIEVAPIDASGEPTGQVFATETTDDLGTFGLSVDYAGDVALSAEGFYFDEVAGTLSAAPVTLRAVAEVTGDGDQAIHVSVVTHLAAARAKELMASGAGRVDAVDQAESDLLTALGIGPSGFSPGAVGTDLDLLGGDTDGNAWLFAVSAAFLQAARDEAGADGPVEATLQELLNTFAADLADDGTVDVARTDALQEAQAALCTDRVTENLQARLDELGSAATVPDLSRVLDHDLDGVADADDTDGVGSCWLDGTRTASEVADHALAGETPEFGRSGAFVGDVDGDGAEDLALIDHAAGSDAGELYVYRAASGGPADTPTATLTGLYDDGSVVSVAGVGDVDGDGVDDLLVGDCYASDGGTPNGSAYLVLGPVTGTASLASARATFVGAEERDYAGLRVAGLGDVDSDGVPDMAVAAVNATQGGTTAGAVYLLSGAGSGTLGPADATATVVGEAGDNLGYGVAGAGDVNGDGVPDLVVGAMQNDVGAENGGSVYVFTHALTGEVSAADADLRVTATRASSSLGTPVHAAGDVDGDGLDDLLLAARNLTGSDDGAAVSLFLGGRTGDLTLSDADAGFVANDAPNDAAGASLSTGDLDGDGAVDLVIAAPTWESGLGRVFVFAAPALGTWDMVDADGILEGATPSVGQLGVLTLVGDADGDLDDDLVLFHDGEVLFLLAPGS